LLPDNAGSYAGSANGLAYVPAPLLPTGLLAGFLIAFDEAQRLNAPDPEQRAAPGPTIAELLSYTDPLAATRKLAAACTGLPDHLLELLDADQITDRHIATTPVPATAVTILAATARHPRRLFTPFRPNRTRVRW
jgi:hypothetical protein